MTERVRGASAGLTALYAALYVPDFPVAVLQRGERRPPPTAVACGESPNRFVRAADASARKRGVREGMALAAPQALRVFDRDRGMERRAQALLLQLAESSTPRFEDVERGLLALDFRGRRNPYASAAKLASGAARLGLQAGIGVSGTGSSRCARRVRRKASPMCIRDRRPAYCGSCP